MNTTLTQALKLKGSIAAEKECRTLRQTMGGAGVVTRTFMNQLKENTGTMFSLMALQQKRQAKHWLLVARTATEATAIKNRIGGCEMSKRKSFWKRHAEGKKTRYHQRAAMWEKIRQAPTLSKSIALRKIMAFSMTEPSRMRRWLRRLAVPK